MSNVWSLSGVADPKICDMLVQRHVFHLFLVNEGGGTELKLEPADKTYYILYIALVSLHVALALALRIRTCRTTSELEYCS